MDTVNPASIARVVVFGGIVLGLLLGIAGQATRFCGPTRPRCRPSA